MTEDTSDTNSKTKNVKSSQRTRTGCLTCRHRKKKCDESHPSCAGCRRNTLDCQWESSISLSKPRSRRRQSQLSQRTLPEQAQRMVSVFSVLTPDITSRLLGHFMDESPRWMSTRRGPKRAEYLEYLHPAISASPLVLNCILTIASADLLKYRRGDSELRHVALEYYGKAISSLRNEITNEMNVASSIDTPLTDYNLLAVLLLCLHETQNFTESERILPHLNAAVLLLQNRICRGSLHLDLRGYLYEVFCYFFSLTAFSLGHKLSLIRAYAIFDSPSFIGNIHHGHIMGSCQRLFTTIFRFSTLTQALASDDLQSQSAARFELLQMDEELRTCQVGPAAEQAPGFEHDDSTITYELYRLACRIHVKVLISSGTPNQDGAVQSLVEAFVAHLQTLPPNSPSHSILSWPLVIAGVSATESRHQRAIVNKLAHIYEDLQAEIFSKSAAFLRAKWKKDRDSKLVHSDIPPQCSAESVWRTWHNCPVILA